jgi:hypothetical protein
MPRADTVATTAQAPTPKPQRTFPRPWSFKPGESGFVVFDANGIEMLHVPFVSSEMQAYFPDSKTHDEALTVVRWMVKSVNDQGEQKPRPTLIQNAPARRRAR